MIRFNSEFPECITTIDFRFAEQNVMCLVELLNEDKQLVEIEDAFQSYMENVVGDDEYVPIEVVYNVMRESGLEYKIIVPEHTIFVE